MSVIKSCILFIDYNTKKAIIILLSKQMHDDNYTTFKHRIYVLNSCFDYLSIPASSEEKNLQKHHSNRHTARMFMQECLCN